MNAVLNHPAARDAALLLLRAALGLIFIAHGWQKVFIVGMNGPSGTIAVFQSLSVPQPSLSAWFIAIVEMLGGAMLIVGLLTTAVAGMLALLAALIFYYVHFPKGFFAEQGGFEFIVLVFVGLLVIVIFGSGRVSLDRALSRFA